MRPGNFASGDAAWGVLLVSSVTNPTSNDANLRYWRANLKYVMILLAVWFSASYGAGIIFAKPLNAVKLGGYPLGFWFAQQGSIYIFVALIFVYVRLMSALDRKFDVRED
jgi:putative solute:sodium symporter small subunit